MRPYGISAGLVRRAGEDTRPYGVGAGRRAAHPCGGHPPGARMVEAGTNPRRSPSGSGRGLGPVLNGTAPVGLGATPEGTQRKALETLVSKRRFAYFADAGKVGRPQAKPPHPPSPVKFLIPNS